MARSACRFAFLVLILTASSCGSEAQPSWTTGPSPTGVSSSSEPPGTSEPVSPSRVVYASWNATDADLWTIQPDGTQAARLTRAPGQEFLPAWSPDGRQVAFTVWPASGVGGAEIGVIDADGANQQVLTQSEGRCSMLPTWSPDGTSILFWSSWGTAGQLFDCWLGEHSLWVMDADGSNPRQITPQEYPWLIDPGFSWSPDGSRVVVSACEGASLYLVSLTDASLTLLAGRDMSADAACLDVAGSADAPTYLSPSWSPTGEWIAVAGQSANGGLQLVSPDGSRIVPLETTSGVDVRSGPVWSPDGSLLAFVAGGWDPEHTEWTEELYAVGLDGVGPILLARFTQAEEPQLTTLISSVPSWSPDGTRLAFTVSLSTPEETSDLYIAAADGSGATNLTQDPDYQLYGVAWSP